MGSYDSRPWLEAIVPLVPREYELPEVPVYSYLVDSFRKYPNNIAVYYYGAEFTYAE